MTRVATEQITLQVAREDSPGVLPGSPNWRELEPDNIGQVGVTTNTVERRPISKNRQAQQGLVTSREAAVEFDTDVTMSAMYEFADGFVYAQYVNWDLVWRAADATTSGYTIPGATSNQAAKVQWVTSAQATLVYARGYATAGNNGLKAITADLAAAGTNVPISSGLANETAPATALLEVAGVRVSTSDLAITVSGSTATLVSAADITDWSTLGLVPGMYIHVGGLTGSEQFSAGADFARIASISGATLNLDKLGANLATDPGTGETLDVLFGQFARNVAVDQDDDDNRFLEQDYQFEVAYPRSGTSTFYEYNIGNRPNQASINLGLQDKATMSLTFVGLDADDITTTRKTNASSGVAPTRRAGFSTGANIGTIRTSAIGASDDVCFKSLTLTLNNQASPEFCLGSAGASAVNAGIFLVGIEAQAWFTSLTLTNAIKNNTPVTFDTILTNSDGAIAIDVPSLTFGNGAKEFPRDQTVLINLTGQAFEDSSLGTSVGISLFPVVPTS